MFVSSVSVHGRSAEGVLMFSDDATAVFGIKWYIRFVRETQRETRLLTNRKMYLVVIEYVGTHKHELAIKTT